MCLFGNWPGNISLIAVPRITFGRNLLGYILFYFILYFTSDIIASQTSTVYTFEEKKRTFKWRHCRRCAADADDVESFSILATGFVSAVHRFLCLPCVSVHMYWSLSDMFLFTCSCVQLYLVLWWQSLYIANPAGRRPWCSADAGDITFFSLIFDTKAAGLMLSRIQMSDGLFRDKVIEKTERKPRWAIIATNISAV